MSLDNLLCMTVISKSPSWLRTEGPLILALIVLGVGCSLLRLWPVFFSPDSVVVGAWNHPDNLGNHWLLVWVAEQIYDGESILHNQEYYLPVGDHPWLAGNGSHGVLYLPFQLLFGWPVAVAAQLFAQLLWLTAGAYVLGRVAGVDRWPALIIPAGCLMMTYWARELSCGRFSQADISWLVWSCALFMSLWTKQHWRWAIACGFCVAMTGFLYWYYAFFFVMFAGITVGSSFFVSRQLPIRQIVVAAVTALVLISPLIVIFMSNWDLVPGVPESAISFPSNEAERDSLIGSSTIEHLHGRNAGATVPLVLSVLALIGGFWGTALRTRLVMACIALVFWTLSMGVHTPVFELVYGWSTPLRRFWWPSRHIVLFQIAVSVLAGVGLMRVISALGRPRLLTFLGCALVPVCLWLQGDRPMTVLHAPIKWPVPVYQSLKQLPPGGIWQPPINPGVANSQAPLIFHLLHQRPMLNGHALWVDRVRRPEWDSFVKSNSLLHGLHNYEVAEHGSALILKDADIQSLLGIGLRYVVLDQELFSPRLPQHLRGYRRVCRELFGPPLMEQDGVTVWDIQNWTGVEQVALPKWTWPKGTKKGEQGRRLQLRNHRSKVLLESVR